MTARRDPLWVIADFAPDSLSNREVLVWAGGILAALKDEGYDVVFRANFGGTP